MTRPVSGLLAVAMLAAACSREPAAPPPSTLSAAPAAAPAADPGVILCVGTSLTAGYGLDTPDQAYPTLLQERIDAAKLPYRVVNAGVSGETSAGARRRIDWLMKQKVAVLVVETGANDGLRGIDPADLRANLEAILERARRQAPAPKILLVGMEALPNYGADYGRRFRAVYTDLAKQPDVTFLPFLLEGVAGVPALNQPDGIHPSPEGQKRIAGTVWAALEPMLR